MKKSILLIIIPFLITGCSSSQNISSLEKQQNINNSIAVYNDINSISLGLLMYHNDSGSYPVSIEANKPLVFKDVIYFTPSEIKNYKNPEFCPKNTNSYNYISINNGASYELNYCLDQNNGDMPFGLYQAGPESLYSSNDAEKINNYIKNQSLVDLKNWPNTLISYRTLSQVTQIRTLLELCYDDINGYPDDLKFGGTLTCGVNNFYLPASANYNNPKNCQSGSIIGYTKENKDNYKLNYCLEENPPKSTFPTGASIATKDKVF